MLGVMGKDVGGWGFEGFKGDSKSERAVGKNAAPPWKTTGINPVQRKKGPTRRERP